MSLPVSAMPLPVPPRVDEYSPASDRSIALKVALSYGRTATQLGYEYGLPSYQAAYLLCFRAALIRQELSQTVQGWSASDMTRPRW